MSRILKRPMFRKGGPAMEGVMTGIKDREKFAVKGFTQAQIDALQGGSQAERIKQQAALLGRFAGAPSRQAALTNFLLRFGPAIASRPSTGNIFTDVLGAAKAPAADLAKQIGAEDQFKRQLGLTAASGVLAGDRALKLAAIKKAGELGTRKTRATDDVIQNKIKANRSFYDNQIGEKGKEAPSKSNIDAAIDLNLFTMNNKKLSIPRSSVASRDDRYIQTKESFEPLENGNLKISGSSANRLRKFIPGKYYIDITNNKVLSYVGDGEFKSLGTLDYIKEMGN